MERYASYKPSGIEWIGDIPKGWDVRRVKSLARRTTRKGYPNKQVLSLYRDYGIVPKESRDDNHNRTSDDTSSYQLVEVDDLVINKMKAWQGSIALSKYEGIVSPAYYVYSFRDSMLEKRYVHYLLRDASYLPEYRRLSGGIRIGQWDLSSDNFDNIPVLIPPTNVQIAIADYLDEKTTKIDVVVKEIEESIAKLEEYRKSIISEAVTKGLDPTVPMKDSDIDWIGQIPATWGIIRAKQVVQISNGSDPQTEGDIPVYGSGFSSFKTCGEYKLGPAVLLGRKGATLHIPHWIEGKYWNVDTAFNVNAISELMILKYYFYLATCFDYAKYRSQTTLPSMTQTDYGNMALPLPSREEQDDIVTFTDACLCKVDELIKEKVSLRDRIISYRKSLISECVTGKVKVPGVEG